MTRLKTPVNFSDDYLTPAEVARLKRVSRQAVYNWISAGALACVKDRRGKLFVRRNVAVAFRPNPVGRPEKEKV